jgi:hypothetical protein
LTPYRSVDHEYRADRNLAIFGRLTRQRQRL